MGHCRRRRRRCCSSSVGCSGCRPLARPQDGMVRDKLLIFFQNTPKTAYALVPNAIRSLDWLRQNGMCLDHLQAKPSMIPHAGYGAFARRHLPKGTLVVPAAVLPLSIHHLDVFVPYSKHIMEMIQHSDLEMEYHHPQKQSSSSSTNHRGHIHHQSSYHRHYWHGRPLLWNYVYGHPNTSLVFFPYTSAINLINHNGTHPNVKLQWSQNHNPPLHTLTSPNELLQNPRTFLIEVIATRDIQEGEEVVLDYGMSWQEAWETYLQQHMHLQQPIQDGTINHQDSSSSNDDTLSVWQLNEQEVLRTLQDDGDNYYPPHVLVLCWIDYDADKGYTAMHNGLEVRHYTWQKKNIDFNDFGTGRQCQLLSRHQHHSGVERYSVVLATRSQHRSTTTTTKASAQSSPSIESIVVQFVPRRAIQLVRQPYNATQFQRSAFRHYIQLPDDFALPEIWHDQTISSEETSSSCGLYMAESSIPHSGWGMYTATEISKQQRIFSGDVVIQVEDLDENMRLRRLYHDGISALHTKAEPNWLLDDYYWNSGTTKGWTEAEDVESIVPGLGMLANSHPGLFNARMGSPQTVAVLNARVDPGAGTFSDYSDMFYVANQDIKVGQELFVDYGDEWFQFRMANFGTIPLRHDYRVADILLAKFWKLMNTTMDSELTRNFWKMVVSNPFWNKDNLRNNKNRGSEMVPESFSANFRIRVALPDDISDVPVYVKLGSAQAALPNHIRSLEWLEKHGRCLDNIEPGMSPIPQAGRGAFATRRIAKGQIVAPLPLVHIHRRHLEIYESAETTNRKSRPKYLGQQLLLNYCFGNPKSNLLLFPYSPVVNYVNHNATNFNVKIQWSNMSGNHLDWMDRTPEDLMAEDHAGLVMELIATRDIAIGEEILLDYGYDWDPLDQPSYCGLSLVTGFTVRINNGIIVNISWRNRSLSTMCILRDLATDDVTFFWSIEARKQSFAVFPNAGVIEF